MVVLDLRDPSLHEREPAFLVLGRYGSHRHGKFTGRLQLPMLSRIHCQECNHHQSRGERRQSEAQGGCLLCAAVFISQKLEGTAASVNNRVLDIPGGNFALSTPKLPHLSLLRKYKPPKERYKTKTEETAPRCCARQHQGSAIDNISTVA